MENDLVVERQGNGCSAVQVQRLRAAVFLHFVGQPGQLVSLVFLCGPSRRHDQDIMPGLDHAQRDPGLGIVVDLFQVRMHFTLGQQPGTEGKHLHSALLQVFFRGQGVAVEGFHASVLVHRQGVQVRPGPFLLAVPRLGRNHFAIADHHAVIVILRLSLSDRRNPQAVHVVGHRQDGRILFDQVFHVSLLDTGIGHALQLQAVLGSGLDHAQRGFRGGPDFRHAVYLLLFLLGLFLEPGNFDGQVFGGILPDSLVLIFQDVFLSGIVVSGQEALFVKMPAVLLCLFRQGKSRQQEQQRQGQGQQSFHHFHQDFFFRM